ncbi:peptidoglycan bridge formation glycyltransferase FemA/FemB family protein [Bacillus sp. USDA818B3_A]|uniref:peptidoglycan bridge formation glycyltransferase FemA/FemB family protein n=1 Tax=Bacillus sp. USDA818B3_A TaxID=2698834 RepID=UPI001F017DFF|nr:peptidoglycan bridge formation glycyltransferase FemA/FemB family protein [Bacillus sp. USDA818B3_A]
MKIITYTDEYESKWDNFVQNSKNGTFMQQRKFLNYHSKEKFQDCSLMAFDTKDRIIAVIPAALKFENESSIFCSHPGASHGGIIINQSFDTAKALTLIPLLIEHCNGMGVKAIEMKMVPRIYHSWPSDEIDFSLRYFGFTPEITELATALPLKNIENYELYMEKNAIRNKNKAINSGVVVKENNDLAGYWGILESNLLKRHNSHPTHTYNEILDLRQRFPEKIKLFSAFYEKKMIAGVLVFILNNRVLNCFYICHDENFQQLRPLNLVFSALIQLGVNEGFHFLDWGISTENKGKAVNQGLFKFKEGFAGRGVLRETYRLTL